MILKRIFGAVTTVTAVALMCITANAAAYSLESKTAAAGDTVTVKLMATPNAVNADGTAVKDPKLNGYALGISYDSNILTPVSVGKDATDAYTYGKNLLGSGVMVADISGTAAVKKLTVAWADQNPKTFTSNMQIAEFQFKIAPNTTAKSAQLALEIISTASGESTYDVSNVGTNGTITIQSAAVSESTTETTTAATETTTKSMGGGGGGGGGTTNTTETPTETTTANTSGSGDKKEFDYGDANADKTLNAADSSIILQKVLKGDGFTMPIEKKTSDYKKYIDVNKDNDITTADAALVLQKTLNNSFKMPVEK